MASHTNDPPVATDGREIGERAKATRRKLLDATRVLLTRHGFSDVRLVDITREIGASPATFYQYFTDIDDALLALSNEVTENSGALIELLEAPWAEPADYERAVAFIDAYIAYWADNRAVLRVRNLKAEEGNADFRRARSAAQLPLMQAISTKVENNMAAGRISADLDTQATAAAVLAMLERLTAYRAELSARGTGGAALETTLSRIVFQLVTGHSNV